MVTQLLYPHDKTKGHVTESYNAVLSHQELIENAELSFFFDNYATQRVCQHKHQITTPSMIDIDYVMCQFMNNITSSFRFMSQPNYDFRKIMTSMIPFPRMHFMAPSLAGANSLYSQ